MIVIKRVPPRGVHLAAVDNKEIEVTIPIVVAPSRVAGVGAVRAWTGRDMLEGAIAPVVQEHVHAKVVRNKQVQVTVVVVIAGGVHPGSVAGSQTLRYGRARPGERAVAIVMVDVVVGRIDVVDIQVGIPIIVIIAPDRAMPMGDVGHQWAGCDLGEGGIDGLAEASPGRCQEHPGSK